jgi:hypothetical protein
VSFDELFNSETMKNYFNAQTQRVAFATSPPEKITKPGQTSKLATSDSNIQPKSRTVVEPTHPKSGKDLSPSELKEALEAAEEAAASFVTDGKSIGKIYAEISSLYEADLGKNLQDMKELDPQEGKENWTQLSQAVTADGHGDHLYFRRRLPHD